MTATDKLLAADTAAGPIFACIAPAAHHVEASVSERRLAAILRPFRSEADARAALLAAGGRDVRAWRRGPAAASPAASKRLKAGAA